MQESNVYFSCSLCKLFQIVFNLDRAEPFDEEMYLKHMKEKHGLIP